MSFWSRRQWLRGAVAAMVGSHAAASRAPVVAEPGTGKSEEKHRIPLDLNEFQPKSMLHVPETKVARSKFPVIDVHTHLSFRPPARTALAWAKR